MVARIIKPQSKLRRLRKGTGMYQKDVAELLGISNSRLSRLEHGITPASEELAQKMADLFDVRVEELEVSIVKYPTNNSKTPMGTVSGLAESNPTKSEIDEVYSSLTKDNQQVVLKIAKSLARSQTLDKLMSEGGL